VVNIFEAEFLWCGKEKGLVKGGIKKKNEKRRRK